MVKAGDSSSLCSLECCLYQHLQPSCRHSSQSNSPLIFGPLAWGCHILWQRLLPVVLHRTYRPGFTTLECPVPSTFTSWCCVPSCLWPPPSHQKHEANPSRNKHRIRRIGTLPARLGWRANSEGVSHRQECRAGYTKVGACNCWGSHFCCHGDQTAGPSASRMQEARELGNSHPMEYLSR